MQNFIVQGGITVGTTVIDAESGNVTVGGATIVGSTGEIKTSANISVNGNATVSGGGIASGGGLVISTIDASTYTVQQTDSGKLLDFTNSNVTVTLPQSLTTNTTVQLLSSVIDNALVTVDTGTLVSMSTDTTKAKLIKHMVTTAIKSTSNWKLTGSVSTPLPYYLGSWMLKNGQTDIARIVPVGATYAIVRMWGSGAAASIYVNGLTWGNSGAGGYSEGIISNFGTSLRTYVGATANNGTNSSGTGYSSISGGFSALLKTDNVILMVAGGGGCGAVNTPIDGGAGGGTTATGSGAGGQVNEFGTVKVGGGGYQSGSTFGGGGSGYVNPSSTYVTQASTIAGSGMTPPSISETDYARIGTSAGGRAVAIGSAGPGRSGYTGTANYGSGAMVVHFYSYAPTYLETPLTPSYLVIS